MRSFSKIPWQVWSAQTENEAVNLIRHLGSQKRREVKQRDRRGQSDGDSSYVSHLSSCQDTFFARMSNS